MSRLPHTINRPLRVLFVCSEMFPLLKTGGLADVCAALPPALRATGVDVRVLLPAFPSVASGVHPLDTQQLVCPGGQTGVGPAAHAVGPEGVWLTGAFSPAGRDAGAATPDLYLLHGPQLFNRPGNPYTDAQGQPWADSALRFAWLGWAAAQLALGLDPDWQPDVLHGHDWHAGLAPAYLNALASCNPAHRTRPHTVFTVHNLAYQGLFESSWLRPLGLPDTLFTMHGLEFHGQLSFMKAGLQFSDVITTVSPTYAREITTPEQGCGLDGLLRERQPVLHGILNGVDDGIWNPSTDPLLPQRYRADDLSGKATCKAAVQAEMGLDVASDAPLFVAVSRLTEQKGLHVLAAVTDELVRLGGQLAILGAGDTAIESALTACAARHPGAVSVRVGYDEALAHRLVAGGDVILVPSRFEPCGLTQLYGLRYGTLPLVRAVGGLADTVTDCTLENLDEGSATGFVFQHLTSDDLARAIRRALALRRRPDDWRAVQRRGMAQPLGWAAAARAYRLLYEPLPQSDPTGEPGAPQSLT